MKLSDKFKHQFYSVYCVGIQDLEYYAVIYAMQYMTLLVASLFAGLFWQCNHQTWVLVNYESYYIKVKQLFFNDLNIEKEQVKYTLHCNAKYNTG